MKTSLFCFGLALALGFGLVSPPLSAAAPDRSEPIPTPAADQVLRSLKKTHPRLLLSEPELAALKARIPTDELQRRWLDDLRRRGQRMLSEPVSAYVIPDGLRLLETSRRVLHRSYTLALLHRLEPDARYRERLWQELDAAAHFPDWNPRHFLDTAEMTHAFAIAYDWLFSEWTEAQRTVLRTAMVEKGIRLAADIHAQRRGWSRVRHNWNQVCNGGIGMGALAVADTDPELAAAFLAAALSSIQLPMVEYGPDGAWAEGPGYWTYATTYNVVFLAALQTALGTDFGLAQIEGFAEAGTFPIYASGPSTHSFNYADAGEGTIRAPVLFWLARQFQRPEFARYQRRLASGDALDLLWYDSALADRPAPAPALDKYYRHAEVVTFRSAWDDPQALFVGFKAGDNKANHSHLDLGSFILEADGTRWGVDLGADDYNLPAYFGNKRWTYYRLRAEGHNTLVINPGTEPDQKPTAAAPIVQFDSKPARAFAVADLSAAYANSAQSVRRGIALRDRRQVLVQDEVRCEQPATVWWFFHTPAELAIDAGGHGATLTRGSAKLQARIVSPTNATFTAMAAEPLPESPHPPKQRANDRYRKLAIRLNEVRDLRLAVTFTPIKEATTSAPVTNVVPLKEWR